MLTPCAAPDVFFLSLATGLRCALRTRPSCPMRVLLAWNGPATAEIRTVLLRRELPLLQELIAQGVHPYLVLLGDPVHTADSFAAAGIAVGVVQAPQPPAVA